MQYSTLEVKILKPAFHEDFVGDEDMLLLSSAEFDEEGAYF